MSGLRAIARQAAADAILVLEIGVPGSKAFRAAKALKLLRSRRRDGDGSGDFDDFGGAVVTTGGLHVEVGSSGAFGAPAKGGDVHPMAPLNHKGTGYETRRRAERPEETARWDAEPEPNFFDRLRETAKLEGTRPQTEAEFDRWINAMSEDDAYRIFRRHKKDWEDIGNRIRKPGQMHEWKMITMLPDLRRLGVTAEEIRGAGFRSDTRSLYIKDPNSDRVITHHEGSTMDRDARSLAYDFHIALAKAIKAASTRAELDSNIAAVARKWLPEGVRGLPEGLRARLAHHGIYD